MNLRQKRTKLKIELRELEKTHEKIMKYGSPFELAKYHEKAYKLKNQLVKNKRNKSSNKVNELTLKLVFHLADDELSIFNNNFGFSKFKETLLKSKNKNFHIRFGVADSTKTYITNKYNDTYSKNEKESITTLHFIYVEANLKYQNKKPLKEKDLQVFKWLHYYFSFYSLLSKKSICKKQNLSPLSIYYSTITSDKPKYSYYSNLYTNTITTVIPTINKTEKYFNTLDSEDNILLNHVSKDILISSLWDFLNSSYTLPKNSTKDDIVIQDIQFTKTFFKDNRAFIIHFTLKDENWIHVLKENEIGLSNNEYKEIVISEYKSFNSIFRDMLSVDLYYLYPSILEKIN